MTTQATLAGRDTRRGGDNNPPAPPGGPSRQHRAAATTAGVLFITGTVAGMLSKLFISRVQDAADPLAFASTHQGTVVTGALLVMLMGLSLAFVPIVLLPILRPVGEVLAFGYLVIRGAVETTCYVLIAVAWLLLVPMDTVVQGRLADGHGSVTCSSTPMRPTSCWHSCSASAPGCSTSCCTALASFPAGSRCGDLRPSRRTLWPPCW